MVVYKHLIETYLAKCFIVKKPFQNSQSFNNYGNEVLSCSKICLDETMSEKWGSTQRARVRGDGEAYWLTVSLEVSFYVIM